MIARNWKKKVPANKYGAKTSVYKDYRYDSQMEAKYAMKLDYLIMAGEITEFKRQHKLSLDIDGKHIANYYVDFRVTYSDGREEFHEVKGFPTPEWQLKWKMAKAIYGENKFILITK
jgi:hypothetical protein